MQVSINRCLTCTVFSIVMHFCKYQFAMSSVRSLPHGKTSLAVNGLVLIAAAVVLQHWRLQRQVSMFWSAGSRAPTFWKEMLLRRVLLGYSATEFLRSWIGEIRPFDYRIKSRFRHNADLAQNPVNFGVGRKERCKRLLSLVVCDNSDWNCVRYVIVNYVV